MKYNIQIIQEVDGYSYYVEADFPLDLFEYTSQRCFALSVNLVYIRRTFNKILPLYNNRFKLRIVNL